MANDVYLKIEGIGGESEDDKHRNWIEVNNVLYAVTSQGQRRYQRLAV
jgi:type VI secretion system secreted protein Hcp